MIDPWPEYEARRAAWLNKQALFDRQFISIGNARLAVAVAAILLAWLAYGTSLLSAWWLLVPLATFLALVVWHERVTRNRTFAARGLRYYDQALNRIKNQWQGKGETGERFRNANHVYAEDLDLFGKGGLFELLCTARTAAGEDALAEWLLQPAQHKEAAARQQAVQELSTRLDLREDLALLGEDVRSHVRASVITQWGARPPIQFNLLLPTLAFSLSLAALLLALGLLFHVTPAWPLALVLIANLALLYIARNVVAQIVASVDTPASHLAILALLIRRIETEEFQSPFLRNLVERMRVGTLPAAAQIRRLGRWIEMLGMSSHSLMKIIEWGLLWRLQVAFAIETWRRVSGPHIGEWIEALGEFEALSALGSLKFERPAWIFPELLETDQASFVASALCHPLIEESRAVANDVALNAAPRLLIVSGSNMSGKSTLLRAIGLNTVLAWAGAPVNAAQLKLSPLATGASIRVTDSLQDNRSRFFAEITRLRQIVDLTRDAYPVLFLLDELLSGTNSHDRRIGASGLVKGLLRGNTIGLLTTHDLALAEIATDVGPAAANVHFEDRITDGQVEFDYRLHSGVVTHSNALELMRTLGLEV
jgi:MutS-like protein